jgi:hypothetical protein
MDAYVHRWDLVGDDWVGTGWAQLVCILITNAVGLSSMPAVPVRIDDGRVKVGTITHENLIPLPFVASETVALWMQLANADELNIDGDSIHIEASGEARFVEKLPADWGPP